MVLIPNTTGMESANTTVIGRRSPVARDNVAIVSMKYRSNSVTKRRAHWSLKTWCGMLPITCKQKITPGPSFFFKGQMSELSLTA